MEPINKMPQSSFMKFMYDSFKIKLELPPYLQVFSDENINKISIVSTIIAAIYMIIIMYIGPAYMKNRPPYKLKKLLIVYNFFQVIANLFLAFTLSVTFIPHLSSQCGIVQSQNFPEVWNDVRWVIESIYLLKVIDLFDTLFFVLRKKYRNVSFLHVYHHALVPVLFSYAMSTFSVGFSFGFGLVLNSVVHAIMYLYYGLAAFGPRMKKYLWWKRYLTMMQMIQFGIIMTLVAVNLYRGCEVLGNLGYVIFFYILTILILFLNYYKHAFITDGVIKISYSKVD